MADFDDVLAELRRRREALLAQLSRVEAAMRALESEMDFIATEFPTQSGSGAALLESTQKSESPSFPLLSPEEVASIARKILLEIGKPLKRGALVKAIEMRGYALPGADKSKNLGTILWRHTNEFINFEKIGYWPRDVPIQDFYDPSID